MSRSVVSLFAYICIILMIVGLLQVYASQNTTRSISADFQDMPELPVNVTDWKLQVTEINGRLDLMVDILYSYNFTNDERLTTAALFLSLDNETFTQAQRHDFDPEQMSATGEGGFFFSNAIGDPLPFDVYQGNILYGYVEFTTTSETYVSPRVALEIPIDVIRPFLFRIPPSLFYVGGIAAGILPLIIIAYCVTRRKKP
ncbi:MAG: hypothetical protein ACFFER_05435 [Candidatus Thorarchaeota archaeon]